MAKGKLPPALAAYMAKKKTAKPAPKVGSSAVPKHMTGKKTK